MRIIESMTTIHAGEWLIRIWREEEAAPPPLEGYPNQDLQAMAMSKTYGSKEMPTCFMVAEALAELPRVNAVEVKDAFGNGVVIYTDWP